MALDMLSTELKHVNYLTLCCDASNRGNLKMFPIMVCYFSPLSGSQCKLIDLFKIDDETGETIFSKLSSVWQKNDFRNKVKGFAGDNCPTNFGGITRGGDKNVFHRLQEEFNNQLVGIGCMAHLVHKAIENASHKFQPFFDIEATVVKIYGYFSKEAVRNSRLQQLNSSEAENDIKLLGYSNTRFLGLQNCIDRIIKHFDVLKEFFSNEKNPPLQLLWFFDHQLARLLLIFVRDECRHFELTIRAIEGTHISGYEATKAIFALRDQTQIRMEEGFFSLDYQRERDNVENLLPFKDTVLVKNGHRSEYTELDVNDEFLKDMTDKFYSTNNIFLFLLRLPILIVLFYLKI